MVFKATFINISIISWLSVLLVEETEYPEKTKLYQILLHRVHLAWAGFKLTTLVVIGTNCIGSYKSNYHTTRTHDPFDLYRFHSINYQVYFTLPWSFNLTKLIIISGPMYTIWSQLLKPFKTKISTWWWSRHDVTPCISDTDLLQSCYINVVNHLFSSHVSLAKSIDT